jgi:hypothetical protein
MNNCIHGLDEQEFCKLYEKTERKKYHNKEKLIEIIKRHTKGIEKAVEELDSI